MVPGSRRPRFVPRCQRFQPGGPLGASGVWELFIPGLDEGGFDAQGLYAVPAVKLIRRGAVLTPMQLKEVEERVKLWLGLT